MMGTEDARNMHRVLRRNECWIFDASGWLFYTKSVMSVICEKFFDKPIKWQLLMKFVSFIIP